MNGKYKYSYYNLEVKRYGLIKKDMWVDIQMIKSMNFLKNKKHNDMEKSDQNQDQFIDLL